MSFLQELKRRKVFKVAAGYAVVAWLLVEVVVTIEQPLGLPDWFDTFTIVLLAIGFPVAIILSWAFDVTPDGIRPDSGAAEPSVRQQSFLAFSQVLVLLAVGFLVVNQFVLRQDDSPVSKLEGVIRYQYKLADEERLVPTGGLSLDVSEDGRRIVYVGAGDETGRQLWIRDRDAMQGRPLPGTEDAVQPFFSPDGETVAYVSSDRQLKKISADGDDALTLVDGGLFFYGGDWAEDGYIYFTSATGFMRISARGGAEELVIAHDSSREELLGYAWPNVIAEAGKVLLTVVRNNASNQIAIADLATGDMEVLLEGQLARLVRKEFLVYSLNDGALMATRFDTNSTMTRGEPVLFGNFLPAGEWPDLAISSTGRLVYVTSPRRTLEAVWVDRDGNWSPVDPDNRIESMRYATLSPDDSMLALASFDRPPYDDGQIWIKQLPDGPLTRLTYEGIVNHRPAWHPNGQTVMFISDRGENRDVWGKRADGATEAERLLDYEDDIDEAVYSSDGSWVVHRRGAHDGLRDILATRPGVDPEPTMLVESGFDEVAPALSPDDRWLAFVSVRDGSRNVYVRPFPEADREVQVSSGGGIEPVWSPSTKELFYRDPDGNMVSARYRDGDRFVVESRTRLFDTSPYRWDGFHATFDVTSDAQRFVMLRLSDSGSLDEDLNVVENWLDEVTLALPAD